MKRIALVALTVILAAAIWRIDRKQAEIKEIDRLDKLFGDISDSSLRVVYLEEDPELVEHRNRFSRQCLKEAVERRAWDAEIRDGLRCSHCKGPHIWEWCEVNPRAPKLEDLR